MSINRTNRLTSQMETQCVFYEKKLISYKFWSMLCYVPFDDGCFISLTSFGPLPPITTFKIEAETDCTICEI
jgi:hypothetical protein